MSDKHSKSGNRPSNMSNNSGLDLAQNQSCAICKAAKRKGPCPGHKATAGKENSNEFQDSDINQSATNTITTTTASTIAAPKDEVRLSSESLNRSPLNSEALPNPAATPLSTPPFNTAIISELLSKNWIVINNDKKAGALSLQLVCPLPCLSDDQKKELTKLVNALVNELNAFKKENKLPNSIQPTPELNKLLLILRLPTPKLYDNFIKRLEAKQLLPLQNITQQENTPVTYPQGMNHFNPSPLSTKPSHSGNIKKTSENDNQTTESSFLRPRSPISIDGPKRK